MPRNAAKKTNKSAKRLPGLIKLNKTINNKKKKRNRNRVNKNNNKRINSSLNEIEQRKKHKYNKTNTTFTTLNEIQFNCNANDNILISKTLPISDERSTTKIKNIRKISKDQKANSKDQEQQESISECIKLNQVSESELKELKCGNVQNNFTNEKLSLNTSNRDSNTRQIFLFTTKEETNISLTSLSETDTKLSETASPLLSASPNSSTSSLYPIVIQSTEPFQHDKGQKQKEKDTSSKNKKIHSNNNCNKNRNKKTNIKNNSNRNNNNNICAYCHIAVDSSEQQKSQKNNSCNNNNITTTLAKHYSNNSNKQKQSTQTSAGTATATATSATKTLTFSKPSSSSSSNQSQEVKARLATLRTRKKVSAQQEQTVGTPNSTTDKDIQSCGCKSVDVGRHFIRKVAPVLDNATLNLIETLTDEVKKPTNKRKRNTAVVLLGLATLNQRPKRAAANPASLVDKQSTCSAAVAGGAINSASDKNDQKLTAIGFRQPLPVESINTASKKRARIMSLYERPFQTANDGRGSVVSNGYMTSSRSSASSSGMATGLVVMNDTCDTQDISSQYYLSGSSGAGIGGNSNQSLLVNGSAINHAPTMGTLCNIGNTCYLNSVVYTLRFAPQFLHNLHHLLADLNALQQNIARARAKSSSLGRGITAVHMENVRSWSSKDLASMEQYSSTTSAIPAASTTNSTALTQVTQKSIHQLLTEKLHELYQSLHRNEINESSESHHADTLLHAIQDVSSIFEGNQQQDAHEFLMCLLNSVRETSQTLIKAVAECPDVILNGYISNPDEIERDLIKNHTSGASGVGVGVGVGSGSGNNSNNSNSLASASSKTSLFFSRKSKRKDDSKSSKSTRLQSPMKDGIISSNSQTTTTANSLFYLNTNDLNLSSASPAAVGAVGGTATGGPLTPPANSASSQIVGVGDETDTPTAMALLLKDKQRLEGKIKELGLDFFNEDFEGITVSTTKCLSCETITEQKETMIDIAVPVPQSGKEFKDTPSSFIQKSCITREYFSNENKYRCEQCCGYTEAIRSISYEVLPRLLIIQLSRFSGGMEKINSYIPTSFTLQCFCSKCCKLSDANKLHIYKLYSVITHVGATMSVGHYIAYTCSLEWANEYINCPKEQRRRASQERSLAATGNGAGTGTGTGTGPDNSSQSTASSGGLGTSSTGFMKIKMKFGRSKASSSGDMSKNVKQTNGLSSSSKSITNGIGKLTMNNSAGGNATVPPCPVTCQSINCCAMRLTAQQQLQYQSANNSTSDFSEESSQYSNGSGFNAQANYNNNIHHPFATSTNTSGYGSAGRGSTKASYATIQNNCSEPIWYMCDDDKIKAMTQREFEELLSPARKITITPYLLFYARYNLQSTPPKSATASTSSPGPVTASPQTSWSNESLQSSGHSAQSSGMHM